MTKNHPPKKNKTKEQLKTLKWKVIRTSNRRLEKKHPTSLWHLKDHFNKPTSDVENTFHKPLEEKREEIEPLQLPKIQLINKQPQTKGKKHTTNKKQQK